MEICCGAAGLSAALRECGFTVFAVDSHHNRHSSKMRPLLLDLSKQHCQTNLMDLLHRVRPFYIHLGLPCGTCSRARERALPSHLRHMRAPEPLGSQTHPLGLPTLHGANLEKVNLANELYHFAIQVIIFGMTTGPILSIENPHRSCGWY